MPEHKIIINQPAAAVFAAYADVASWPIWDSEVKKVSLPNGLITGATGYLTPRSGPKAKIYVVAVDPAQGFTIQSRLPLCTMHFGHKLAQTDGKTTATHWVRFTGPLAFLFARLIGRGIEQTLPKTLAGLKAYCEARGGA
ncbi:MAG: SRPBCC family protein [Cypionkella sp.]|nr:SRPBCC family protein [Cypionkella sp.]